MKIVEQVTPVTVTKIGDFGPGNAGEFGPSDTEVRAVEDLAEERYWGLMKNESGCMDDRLEGLRLQLAGNRAVTEVAADYTDRHMEVVPESRAFARKINELIVMDRMPVFHHGCAALAKMRDVLRYNLANEDAVIESTWEKLETLGTTEFLTQQMLHDAVKIGGQRAEIDSLWDANPDELLEVAARSGAAVEETPGEHHVAANLDVMTENGFDNGAFRSDHTADDGEPLGLLVTTWAAYRKQMAEDGFSQADAAKKMMRAVLFNVGTQKAINKDGSPLVTVGPAA